MRRWSTSAMNELSRVDLEEQTKNERTTYKRKKVDQYERLKATELISAGSGGSATSNHFCASYCREVSWLNQEEPNDVRVGGEARDRNTSRAAISLSGEDHGSGNSARRVTSELPWDPEVSKKNVIVSQLKAYFLSIEGGIMGLLKETLIAEDFIKTAFICGYVDYFESPTNHDLAWSCGWCNLQMLCSFLIAEDAEAREILFGGVKFVPDITALQRWLEIAWSKGFDVPGAESFNWRILGTMTGIGTPECATMLRSFGVRAKVVSFSALQNKEGEFRQTGGFSVQPPNEDRTPPAGWLKNGDAQKGRQHHVKHYQLVEWVWRYFTPDSAERDISSQHFVDVGRSNRSPLYFQGQRHSQMIVGIERIRSRTGRSEDVFFLMLDPSHASELLLKTLKTKNGWQNLVKYNVKYLNDADYQLCYVSPGVAIGDELERMKVLKCLKYSSFPMSVSDKPKLPSYTRDDALGPTLIYYAE